MHLSLSSAVWLGGVLARAFDAQFEELTPGRSSNNLIQDFHTRVLLLPGSIGIGQMAVMPHGWEGNRRRGGPAQCQVLFAVGTSLIQSISRKRQPFEHAVATRGKVVEK